MLKNSLLCLSNRYKLGEMIKEKKRFFRPQKSAVKINVQKLIMYYRDPISRYLNQSAKFVKKFYGFSIYYIVTGN